SIGILLSDELRSEIERLLGAREIAALISLARLIDRLDHLVGGKRRRRHEHHGRNRNRAQQIHKPLPSLRIVAHSTLMPIRHTAARSIRPAIDKKGGGPLTQFRYR